MNGKLLKLWGLVLLLAIAPLTGSAWAAGNLPEERMTATVVEFTVRGGDLDEQAGAILADLMMSAIANTSRFILKDRLPLSAAAKIAKSQELGSTGLIDPKTAAELGRVYGVDAVVTGGISKLGDLITVTARLIDTKTASLLGSGQIQEKNIDAIQIKVAELATMIMTPKAYALTIIAEPKNAGVRLLNQAVAYQAGVRLAPGDYEVEIAHPGYKTRKESVRIGDHDLTVTVALEAVKYGLTINPEPADAQVRLLGGSTAYQPGVALPPGDYEVEVTKEGYVARKFPVRIADGAVAVPVVLDKIPPPTPVQPPPPAQYRLTVQTDPPQAAVQLLNAKTPYQPGMRLSPGDYPLEITQSGYEPTRVTVRIADSDVIVPVKLVKLPESEPPKQYRLTVRVEPPTAQIRLHGAKATYKPGVALPPGNYTVEATQSGYETKQVTVRISDGDVTVPITLTKPPEPESYRLTVRADPPTAQIRLRGAKATYKPGVALPPGNYTVEAAQSGYETKQVTVHINDSDVTVPVTLVKLSEPESYRLTVQVDPPDAQVRLRGAGAAYRPGVPLRPGSYTVEATKPGYESKSITVRIANNDVTVPMELTKQPEIERYRLTVQVDPPDARVRLVNSAFTYRPGVQLPPGSYTIEVAGRGYETKRVTARIADDDVTLPVELEKIAVAIPSAPPPLPPSHPGELRISAVQVDGSLSGQDGAEVQRILNGYIGRTATRDTLLNGAMRVYQSTGVTLSFSVRAGASGNAVLYARVARRVRRTYESNIPIMTPSQLENSGFGVSND